MEETVFLDGKFVPYGQAYIHVEDRGNVFADGVYEVIRYYGGRPFEMAEHMNRLERSASAIRLPIPYEREQIVAWADELVERNGLNDAIVYLQVTRGYAPRYHPFPDEITPTMFMTARPAVPQPPEVYEKGVACVTVEDKRWKMCNVKAIGLLPNVLARQTAKESGALEALLVRDGIVTEGSSSNFFMVVGNRLRTHPEGPYILSGITRQVVLELADRLRIEVEEVPFTLTELRQADEAFLTSTTLEIMPVVSVDGRAIGSGTPGPITKDLAEAFAARVQRV